MHCDIGGLHYVHMIVQRKAAAADLIAGHFADGASDPVNVEGAVRQSVMDNAASSAVDLFDAAQKQVRQLSVWFMHWISGALFASFDRTFYETGHDVSSGIFSTELLFTYMGEEMEYEVDVTWRNLCKKIAKQ